MSGLKERGKNGTQDTPPELHGVERPASKDSEAVPVLMISAEMQRELPPPGNLPELVAIVL